MGGKGSGNRTETNTMKASRFDKVDPDTNARCIDYTMALMHLEPIDMSDQEAVSERVDLFFDMCREYGCRPLIANLAASFNMSYDYFRQVINGERPARNLGVTPETLLLMKKAKTFVDVNFEQAILNAKNPVPFIFYAKAQMNWHEAPSETVITHKSDSPRLSGGSADEIAGKYLEMVATSDGVYELPEGSDSEASS